MAYAFDNIMNLVQPDETAGDSDQSAQTAPAASTEIDTGGGGTSQTVAPQTPQQQTQGKNELIQRNRARASSPVDVQGVRQQAETAKQSIQNEANSYISQAAQPYQQSQEQVRQGIQQYAAGKPEASQLVDLYRQAPQQVGAFQLGTSTDIADADLLGTDTGLQQLFKRRADAEYNAGEAALDSALLRGNQDFQIQRDAALQAYRQAKQAETQALMNTQQQAQEQRNLAAEQFRNLFETEGRGILGNIESTAKQRETTLEKQAREQEKARAGNLQTTAQAALDRLVGQGLVDSSLAPYLSTGGLDLSQFYRAGNTDLNYQDFVTEQEATQFNRIQDLLGLGGQMATGRLAGRKPQDVIGGGFNEELFLQAALQQAATAQQRAMEQQALDAQAAAQAGMGPEGIDPNIAGAGQTWGLPIQEQPVVRQSSQDTTPYRYLKDVQKGWDNLAGLLF